VATKAENARLAYLKRSVAGNAAGLLEMLVQARDRINGTIAARAGMDEAPTSKKAQQRLADQVGGHYGNLSRDLETYWTRIYKAQGAAWRKFAWEDAGLPFTETDLQKFSLKYAKEAWAYNLRPYIAAHVQQMELAEKAQLRDAVQKGIQYGRITGATAREVEKDIKARFFGLAGENPNWRFIDKAGRGWTARNYFNMVSRTATANIARTAYMDGLAADGFDIVRVSNAGDPCEACKRWAGRLLSQSGTTKGLPTYQQAVADGVFHPNCVCHLEFVSPTLAAKEIEAAIGRPYEPPEPKPPKVVSPKETGIERNPAQKALDGLPAVTSSGVADKAGRYVRVVAPAATAAELKALAALEPTPEELAAAVEERVAAAAVKLRGDATLVARAKAEDIAAGLAAPARLRLLALDSGALVLAEETEAQLAALLQAHLAGEKELLADVVRVSRDFPALAAVEKGLTEVRALGGTTGAKLVKDARGQLFVMKRGASPEHIREEYLTDAAYKALGVPVPEARLYETASGPVKLARYIKDAETVGAVKGVEKAKAYQQAHRHFAADALLGNWDVTGQQDDNLLVDKAGVVWRIDNGGGLRYRAQGTPKTADEWSEHPTDLWTMRKAGMAAARIMKTADFYQLAEDVLAIGPEQVAALKEALPPQVFATVEARLGHLRDIAERALDARAANWVADAWDGVSEHMIGLRKWGFTDLLPKELLVSGQTAIVDERGIPWGGFRREELAAFRAGKAAPVVAAAVSDHYYNTVLDAAKTVNFHIAKGDKAPNEGKVSALEAIMAEIKSKAGKGDKAAAHYMVVAQETLAKAAAMKAGQQPAGKVPDVALYQPPQQAPAKAPKKPKAPAQTPTEKLQEYFAANGLDLDAPIGWCQNHAGGSGQGDAKAVKHWIAQSLDLPRNAHSWHNTGGTEHGAEMAWKKAASTRGGEDKLRASYAAFHAAQQEILGRVAMPNNDTGRRAFRILRTEKQTNLDKLGVVKGEDRTMPRGVNESGSMFGEVVIDGNQLTVQAVPHSRITGLYLIQRPGAKTGLFHPNEYENEATFIPAAIPFSYTGQAVKYRMNVKGGDATSWGLSLKHLRGGGK
jgi:hypothetical protein